MHPWKTPAAVLALALACSVSNPAAASTPALTTTRATVEADAALNALFERYDQASLARSPTSKAYRGIRDEDYGRWDDPSDEAAAKALAEDLAFLAELRRDFADAPLSPDARLSCRQFERQIERRARAADFRKLGNPFDHRYGVHTSAPAFLINIHRISSKDEAEAYIARLHGLGPVIDANLELARQRADAGAAAPAWVYPKAIDAARGVLKGAPFDDGPDSTLLADFKAKVERLDLPATDKKGLVAQVEDALRSVVAPAYRRLIPALEQIATKSRPGDGVRRLPEGDAYYAERLAFHTTTSLTADEVHALGLAEVARIQDDMRTLMPKLGVEGDLAELFAHIRTSQTLFYPNTDEGRAAYLDQARGAIAAMQERLPEVFQTLPKAPLVVKRVEPFRERTAGKAFYQSPAADGSRPGTYYANLYNMREMPRYEIEALAFHEGIPGHHMQRAIQTELKDLPPFRRFGGFTAYSEGWALYTEYLAKEMGFYQDPWQDFGRLKMDLWRAIRLVVDTGIHHKGWSREQAIQYHLDNTPSDRAEIARAVERYATTPGQATAYAIGKLEILKLREEAQSIMGNRFDIRGFHDVVLRSGPVPLDVLAENVRQWARSG